MKHILKLCCIVSPSYYDFDQLRRSWCTYCAQDICDECINTNDTSEAEGFFHHPACYEKCSHDAEHKTLDQDYVKDRSIRRKQYLAEKDD